MGDLVGVTTGPGLTMFTWMLLPSRSGVHGRANEQTAAETHRSPADS